jgi:hypothetical protein
MPVPGGGVDGVDGVVVVERQCIHNNIPQTKPHTDLREQCGVHLLGNEATAGDGDVVEFPTWILDISF